MYTASNFTSRAAFALFCSLSVAACSDDTATDDEVGETATGTDTIGDSTTNDETGSGMETGSDTFGTTTTDTTDTTATDTTTTDTTDTTATDTTATDTTATDTTATDTTTGDPDVCGDMMVTGDEICDDGINDGAYGGCNPDCLGLAGFCGDAMINGPEQCDDLNGDSSDGCLSTCVAPQSCADLLAFDPALTDGVYLISPDGFVGDPFPATCDMTTDGGGWTLAMRFAPANAAFHFYSVHWTTNTVVNEMVTDPVDPTDGKFMAYNELPGDEIRGCLKNPQNQTWGCKRYDLPATTKLLDLFTTTQVGSDT